MKFAWIFLLVACSAFAESGNEGGHGEKISSPAQGGSGTSTLLSCSVSTNESGRVNYGGISWTMAKRIDPPTNRLSVEELRKVHLGSNPERWLDGQDKAVDVAPALLNIAERRDEVALFSSRHDLENSIKSYNDYVILTSYRQGTLVTIHATLVKGGKVALSGSSTALQARFDESPEKGSAVYFSIDSTEYAAAKLKSERDFPYDLLQPGTLMGLNVVCYEER